MPRDGIFVNIILIELKQEIVFSKRSFFGKRSPFAHLFIFPHFIRRSIGSMRRMGISGARMQQDQQENDFMFRIRNQNDDLRSVRHQNIS